jgi:hypothetical protein
VIVTLPGHRVLADFERVELAARFECPLCESLIGAHAIYVARGPKRPLDELWLGWRDFL